MELGAPDRSANSPSRINCGPHATLTTRKRGTCVLVGLPPGEFPVSLFDVVVDCITIRGSFVGTRQDMAEALAFAAEGKVKANIELQPLSAINEVLGRLQRGDVAARVVLDFAGS
ncbi:zinc-binding dehydrogenase [Sphingomonas sp. IW22]|uniref:zinc-binding dehydrogenase n=1 Tax=Sphingomonas sp. IW22 TaxID=3242489 RepID=UPI003522E2A2